jgi:hypothetical protein
VARARLLVATLASVTAFGVAIACSSSDEGTPAPADGGDAEAASDAPALDEFPPPTPPPQSSDPSFDDFEDPGGCGAWLGDDAVLTWRPVGANGSKGSCQVCITDGGGAMYKLLVLPAGRYGLDALVGLGDAGADAGDAGAWVTSLAFAHADGSDAGFAAEGGALVTGFAPAELTAATVDGARVVMRFGGDGCYYVDDVRLVAK